MSRRISIVRAGLTSVAGLVGIGISGVVMLALCLIPFPVLAGTPLSIDVAPTATTAVRVCPGPLLSVQTRDGDATSYVAAQSPDVVSGSTNDPVSESFLAVQDAENGNGTLAPEALSVAPAGDGTSPLIAGVQAQSVATEEMSGLATSSCVEPEAESWLVGGASDLGQTSLILLANASPTDSTVHLDVFGEKGRVDPTGSNDVVVRAGTQEIVSLAALAPELSAPVVHVTSSGGSIAASMQQTLVRTIVPSGVELIEPGGAANTTAVMTGVRLTGMGQYSDSEGGAVTSDEEPAVRILATTTEPSDVVVTTIAEDGTPSEVKATVRPGVVLQLPFNAVPDGTYTVVVNGTTPIVAAVRSVVAAGVDPAKVDPAAAANGATPKATTPATTATASPTSTPTSTSAATPKAPANGPVDGIVEGGEPPAGAATGEGAAAGAGASMPQPAPQASVTTGGDFTWYASTTALSESTMVAVAKVAGATLTVFNATTQTATATLTAAGQPDHDISVEPGRAQTIAVQPGAVYTLAGTPGLRASVTYSGVGLSSAATVRAPSRLGAAIVVYPR